MPNLSPEQKGIVRRECEGLVGRERTQKVQEMALHYDVCPSTIYRALPATQRRHRADQGRKKLALSSEVLRKMLALTTKGMSAPEVIELAEINGWIGPGAISAPTYNRWLAGLHLSDRQRETWIKPFVRFEEGYANERHYIDITGFPDYFVESDGSIGFESTLSASKNRPGNRKPRLQLFLLSDGFSRSQYGNFYMGKNTLNWVDFAIRAWSPKEDPYAFPFQGRPAHLYSDQEKVFFTPIMDRFLKAMDVHYHHHLPGESRAKGKIERPIGVIQTWLRHAFQVMAPDTRLTLTQANAYLHDLLYKINGRVHGTTHQEPQVRWRAGFGGRTIRLMPERAVTDRFFYTCDYRTIQGDLTVQLQGLRWQLPRKVPFVNFTGQSVPVYYHPGDLELKAIYVVLDDVEHEVTHATPVVLPAGEYRKYPLSDQEKLLRELEEVDLAGMRVDGYKERYAQKTFLPAEGEALDVEALALPRRAIVRIALVERLQELDRLATPPTAAQRAYLDTLYADSREVYEEDLDQVIAGLSHAPGYRQAL